MSNFRLKGGIIDIVARRRGGVGLSRDRSDVGQASITVVTVKFGFVVLSGGGGGIHV